MAIENSVGQYCELMATGAALVDLDPVLIEAITLEIRGFAKPAFAWNPFVDQLGLIIILQGLVMIMTVFLVALSYICLGWRHICLSIPRGSPSGLVCLLRAHRWWPLLSYTSGLR